MATTRGPLSGSDNGQGILVTTASPLDGSDTLLHTAVATADSDDDTDWVTLWATNHDASPVELFIGLADNSNPIRQTIPARSGLTLIAHKLPLREGKTVTASASATSKIVVFGDVLKVRSA